MKSKDKDLIACLGNTGVGKSVFVNYICGFKMACLNNNIVVDPE